MRNIPRLFLEEELFNGKTLRLIEKDFHYLVNVLRKNIDDEVIFVNGKGCEFLGKINNIKKKELYVTIEKKTREGEKINFLGLVFSPIEKIDLLSKGATELGVSDFYPVKMQNTVKGQERVKKLYPNIKEAVEQSERLDFPIIHNYDDLFDFLDKLNRNDIILFCEERSGENSIRKLLELRKDFQRVFVLVGPEGGFSDNEKEKIKMFPQVYSINLGKNILRSETCVISALTIAKLIL